MNTKIFEQFDEVTSNELEEISAGYTLARVFGQLIISVEIQQPGLSRVVF